MVSESHARLRSLFARILAVTGGLAAFGACGGAIEGDPGTEPNPSSPRSLCGPDEPPAFPAGLRASPPQDYVAGRTERAFMFGFTTDALPDGGAVAGVDAFQSKTFTPTGVACATATNPAACRSQLEAVRVLPRGRAECEEKYPNVAHPGGTFPGCTVSYVVFTRGDEVGVAIAEGEIQALIGRVNSVQEAEWILRKTYEPTCGGSRGQGYTVREIEGGYEFVFVNNCERSSVVRTVVVGADASVREREPVRAPKGTEFSCAVAGRRPEGFTPSARGDYFHAMADLEAAAVLAFRHLGRDLAALGAPQALLARVRTAVRDEIRHARATRALAERAGVTRDLLATPPLPGARGVRDAVAIARENAREGCVRESYGALLAWYQATHAADPVVRDTMAAIADDETAHAALSLDVAEWLDGLLTDAERREVAHARADAAMTLRAELFAMVEPRFAKSAGLPAPAKAVALFDALRAVDQERATRAHV